MRSLNMTYSGTTPWAGTGTEMKEGSKPTAMLKAAGLDWKVQKAPLFTLPMNLDDAEHIYVEVPEKYALMREDNSEVLTLVGKGYKPLQNAEAVDFFSKFVEAGDMHMRAMGSVKGGRYVWALAQVGESYDASNSTKYKDLVGDYVLLSSPHVGGQSMRAQYLSTREACWNTISAALVSQGLKGHGGKARLFRMPHSQKFDDVVKRKGHEAMLAAMSQGDRLKKTIKTLAAVKITPQENVEMFYELMRVSPEAISEIKEGKKEAPLMIRKLEDAREKAPGAQLGTAQGSLWGWLNAVTYVVDHEQGRSRDNALYSAWFGEGQMLKSRALTMASATAAEKKAA